VCERKRAREKQEREKRERWREVERNEGREEVDEKRKKR